MMRICFTPLLIAVFSGFLSACSTTPMISPAITASLAPTGTLRAAINYGNAVLAARNAQTGELSGTTVDLARELAKRLNVPVEFTGQELGRWWLWNISLPASADHTDHEDSARHSLN